MRRGVVLSGEQPLWVDGELAHESGNNVDENAGVDRALPVIEQMLKRLARDAKNRRHFIELMARLSRNHCAQSLGNGFDEWIIGRERQRGWAPVCGMPTKIGLLTANRMQVASSRPTQRVKLV